MSKRTRKNALWLGAQAAWGSLPVATYAPARALSVGFVQDGTSVLPTNYATGRNGPTPSERGPDGATIQFELAVTGLAVAAAEGDAPPAKDALDLLFDNAFGAAEEYSGAACAAGTTASAVETYVRAPGSQVIAGITWENSWDGGTVDVDVSRDDSAVIGHSMASATGPNVTQVSLIIPATATLAQVNAYLTGQGWTNLTATDGELTIADLATDGPETLPAYTEGAVDPYDAQDLLTVYVPAASALQWRRVGSDTSPYSLERALSPAPAENDTVYGSRQWTEPGSTGGGDYLTAYVEHDGACYLLRDGRVSTLKLTVQAGQLWKLTVQITFDSKTRGTSAADLGVDALVDPIEGWSPSALKGVLSSVYWGSARLTKSIEIDFMPRTEAIPATSGTNGRGAIEVLQADATAAVEPLFDGALEDDFRSGARQPLTIQLGAGVPASGYVGSLCFFAEAAEIVGPVNITDDAGVQRTALKLAAVDTGAFAGAHRLWRLARA